MGKFPIPDNEEERLEILSKLDLLDNLSEDAFDFVTNIAHNLFDTPIALITIIDKNWQHFKSQVGLNDKGTPREHAFCAYNLSDAKLMVVEDATKDDRFKENPLVTGDPKIRFYAGAPIEAEENVFLGSVCIIDTKPRTMTEEQEQLLEALGRQTSSLVKIRQLSNELRKKTKHLQELQRLLPKCTRCGDVKDSEKYWTSVEAYLETHNDLQFTQSLCPNCSNELDENLELV